MEDLADNAALGFGEVVRYRNKLKVVREHGYGFFVVGANRGSS